MPTYRDQGMVLKAQPTRDADRRYTIFTADHGKITVLAKGSRRGQSKMSPHLSSFNVVDLMIARGRLIDRLAGASAARTFRPVLAVLPKVAAAQSFLLTVDALTKRELPERRIFSLLQDFLGALEAAADGDGRSAGGRIFSAGAIRLLDILGFAPELDACVRCRRELPEEGNCLNVWRGGLECRVCRQPGSQPLAAGAVSGLRRLRLAPLAEAAVCRLSESEENEISAAVERLLTGHIEDRLPALNYLRAVA